MRVRVSMYTRVSCLYACCIYIYAFLIYVSLLNTQACVYPRTLKHAQTHVYKYTATRSHTHTRIHLYTYPHTLVHPHARTRIHRYTHVHIHTHTNTRLYTHISTPPRTHIYTQAYMPTHIHIHIYTHVYIHPPPPRDRDTPGPVPPPRCPAVPGPPRMHGASSKEGISLPSPGELLTLLLCPPVPGRGSPQGPSPASRLGKGVFGRDETCPSHPGSTSSFTCRIPASPSRFPSPLFSCSLSQDGDNPL